MTSVFWVETQRDFVMLEGADAAGYLQSQVTQDLRPLAVGDAAMTLVLAPNGRVEALARVLRSGDHAFVLDVETGAGPSLVARLERFKIRVDARISVIPWRCIAVRGSAEHVADLGEFPVAGGVRVPAWWADGSAFDLIGPSVAPPAGVRQGTTDEYETARVEAVWPAWGAEITASSIAAELGVIPVTVSFTKGCYPGQELVERMDSRGAEPPKSIRRISTGGLRAGDPVVVDGIEVGVVTSVAGEYALALVRRGVDFEVR
jgi:tRNA-modifying protein YgfZ